MTDVNLKKIIVGHPGMKKPEKRTRPEIRFLMLVLLGFMTYILPVFADQPDSEAKTIAIIASDLHFGRNGTISDSIVPGMAFSEELTDLLITEVIDVHPDVFILTGDNTNSGRIEDMSLLAEKLGKITEAGIYVVMTTGNHDFDHCSPEVYKEIYDPLFDMADRDPASMSYTTVMGDYVFLAMDDSTEDPLRHGLFSESTMDWIHRMCSKYHSKECIFLSHHNVFLGKEEEASQNRIQNGNLPAFLKENGIRICFTGHLHSQMIMEDNGLYEIISAMPFNAGHLIGFLEETDDVLRYHAEEIDFERYGYTDLSEMLSKKEEEMNRQLGRSIGHIAAESGFSSEEQETIALLFTKFLSWYSMGTIGNHIEDIKNDSAFTNMINALQDTNYGPWIESILEQRPPDATRLFLPRVIEDKQMVKKDFN